MNRLGTALLTSALVLGTTTQFASASVLNDLIEANRRRAGTEIEFNERQVLTGGPNQVASVLNDLLEDNRRRGGSETEFADRTVA